MKGLRILSLGLAICLASGVKAQISSGTVLFWVSKSENLTNPQANIGIGLFKDGKLYELASSYSKDKQLRTVCDNLKTNINYYENDLSLWRKYSSCEYDSELSNLKWTVYKTHIGGYEDSDGYNPAHNHYSAFKRDMSEVLFWIEPDYDNRGRFNSRIISKSELRNLTFTAARDFLQ